MVQSSSQFRQLDQQSQMIIQKLLDSTSKIDHSAAMSQQINEKIDTLLQVVRRVDLGAPADETVETVDSRQLWNLVAAALRNPASLFGQSSSSKTSVSDAATLLDLFHVPHDREKLLRIKVEANIIKSLSYPSMSNRYESLSEAYPDTFKWALDGTSQSRSGGKGLSEWFKTGQGVYWISGKAGSGKSTLMKYLRDSEYTHQHLDLWKKSLPSLSKDEELPLCLATFFFWNSGQVDQKSQKGMLRSLLFQIFSVYPAIIPMVCDDVWAATYKVLLRNDNDTFTQVWSVKRLMTTLKAIFHQIIFPVRICLLVDGLDEFESEPGDSAEPEDIARLFRDIATSESVKACVSSRPWPIFADIYQGCPFLRLEDLNGPDIITYVKGKFDQSDGYRALLLREPISAPQLIQEVIDKSQGVFLWVRIVVQNILRGIANRDDLSESLRRLRAMPPELEPLYHHLLTLIEKA
jgi:hypothetical protein